MNAPDWIFENNEILVLNKPSGIPSARLPKSPPDQITAVDWALQHTPEMKGIGFSENEAGLLHRLDTGTSGLLVFAKTKDSFKRLRELWEKRKIKKIYRALSLPKIEITIPEIPRRMTWPLAHHSKSAKKMICIPPEKSHYKYRGKLLEAETLILDIRSNKNTLDLTVEIKTGVMHQIRCHLAEIGCPILGDPIYGGASSSRLWLHAWKLEIPLFNNSQPLELTSPLPQDWG